MAHLLIRGSLPTLDELNAYKMKLAKYRGLPVALTEVLERLPAASHPMDVLRTACSVLGCVEPEGGEAGKGDTKTTSERLMCAFISSMCYWYHFSNTGKRIAINTNAGDNMACSYLKVSNQK